MLRDLYLQYSNDILGGCDDFCQNAFALDAKSQAQFEQDFLAFQAQFGNSVGVSQGGSESSPPSNQPTQSSSTVKPFVQTGNTPQNQDRPR